MTGGSKATVVVVGKRTHISVTESIETQVYWGQNVIEDISISTSAKAMQTLHATVQLGGYPLENI